jgi:DNA helicase HerA-like ATPase
MGRPADSERLLHEAMSRVHPERVKSSAQAPAARTMVVLPKLGPADIHLGDFDTGGPMGLDVNKLIGGRLLVQGSSGAGKSWTLRRILEQTTGLIQQIIVDPEGEFRALAEAFDLVVLDAHKLDAAYLGTAALRAREHRLSVLLDVSDLDREEQMRSVASFLSALIEAPREHWHPCIVAVDEAHLFAPFGGQASEAISVRKAAISALVDLMSRGRKRGLTGIIATQRLARLSKSVASEVHNFLIGLNTLDLDIRRAAETIGWDARRAFDRLPELTPGDFVAVGPAFSRHPAVVRVGPVTTKQGGATPTISKPKNVTSREAAKLLDIDGLAEQSAADGAIREQNSLVPGLKAVRAFIRDPAFPNAGRIWGALRQVHPKGLRLSDLESHLELAKSEVSAAIATLDLQGVLEFIGEGSERAVRIGKGMKP